MLRLTATAAVRIGSELLCLACLWGVFACGGGSPKPLSLPAPDMSVAPLLLDSGGVYCPNEHLEWSLTWRGLRGASTQMVVGEPGIISGQDAIIVRSSTQSSPLATMFKEVREELTSEISLVSGRPVSNSGDAREDKERELTEIQFDAEGKGYSAKLSSNSGDGKSWAQQGTQKIHDLHSFIALFRQWEAKPGTRGIALVQNGRSLYRVELLMVGPETVKAAAVGKSAAIRIHGKSRRIYMDGKKLPTSKDLELSIWRSDDSKYLLLRFDVDTRLGIVRGELVEYRQLAETPCIHTPIQ